MKRARIFLTAIAAALLLTVWSLPAMAAFDQSTLDGIILLYAGAPDADGTMSYLRGTGFFVGEAGEDPQYIVTNCHVVEDFILAGKALGGGELKVVFDKDDEAEAYLVDYDAEKDIALLFISTRSIIHFNPLSETVTTSTALCKRRCDRLSDCKSFCAKR